MDKLEELQMLVELHKVEPNDNSFNDIYRRVRPVVNGAIAKAVLRYGLANESDLTALADDALLNALARYDKSKNVPFIAFLKFLLVRHISNYVEGLYYMGRDKRERLQLSDLDSAPERYLTQETESPIRDFMQHLKDIDIQLHDITLALVNGWTAETIGHVYGKCPTDVASRMWVSRRRKRLAEIYNKYNE